MLILKIVHHSDHLNFYFIVALILVHIYLYFLSQLANDCYRENNYCVSKKAHKFLVFSGTKLFASVVISSSEVGFQKQFLTFFALFLAGG